MKASEAGQVECVKVLLDRGAGINMWDKVNVSLYTGYMQCRHVPRVLSSE